MEAPSRRLKAHCLVQLARGLASGHGFCSAKQGHFATAGQAQPLRYQLAREAGSGGASQLLASSIGKKVSVSDLKRRS